MSIMNNNEKWNYMLNSLIVCETAGNVDLTLVPF